MFNIFQTHPYTSYSPHKIIFGRETVKGVAEEVGLLGGTKVFIVTDRGVEKAGLLRPVLESLEAGHKRFCIYDQVEPEPMDHVVEEATATFRSEGCDLILGVGGGSCLDVAKGVSILATNEVSLSNLYGINLVKKRGIPKILIPTTSGSGSEVTRGVVLTDEKGKTKKVIFSPHVLSDVALIDPVLALSMPPVLTADTGMDALVHAIEAYVSVEANPFSDTFAETAIRLIAKYLPIAWAKGSNFEARYHMSLAATLAGLAFGSGGLGAVHGLAYVLGTEFHMSHGRSNAVMLVHVMRFNLCANRDKYGRIALFMGKAIDGLSSTEASQLAAEAVQELLETLQIPFHLREYGIIHEADLSKLVEGGLKQSRLFAPNPRDLTEQDVHLIYQSAI
jgi:alcohol dehydrogenase class IV